MQIDTLHTGPLAVNTYVIRAEEQCDCAVIDPGDAEPVLAFLTKNQLRCTHILLTHGHFDHILGVAALAAATGAKTCIHADDASMLGSAEECLAAIAGFRITPSVPDVLLHDGDVLRTAGVTIRVLHTPGHTMGGVCYVAEGENTVFCGDTVFRGTVGRTDFSHSSAHLLQSSIRERLVPLDDACVLYPGHGEPTTVGAERRHNPYFWS